MNIEILFEDNYLMVINKPAGVVVNRVETERGETVEEWIESRTKDEGLRTKVSVFPSAFGLQPSAFYSRSGIVHRLDKETSGCLIIAKTEEVFTDLQRQFRERKVKKEYLALVHGRVEPSEGTIKVPIARSHHDRDRFAVSPGGRKAETSYMVHSEFRIQNSEFSLLRVFPLTGRTHQIRVHFKYFGHPLVSDEKYGGNTALEDRKWCPRIFLHAAKIEFYHPLNKNKVTVEAGLPEDLSGVVKNLKPSA